MSTKLESVYELRCSCNDYPWGKKGKESLAAKLCEQQHGWTGDGPDSVFKIDDSKAYAEMWMGTYPELPSYIAGTGEDLQDVLDRYSKELVGEETLKKFGHSKLPYLPKVLSISKALPLQVHPNKELAAKLHKEDPEQFTDPNHKPEIAIALSKFEAFCGFKPTQDIADLLTIEALHKFLPEGSTKGKIDNDQLKTVVGNILKADDKTIRDTYTAITKLPGSAFGKYDFIPSLAPRLAEQYSEADPGTLVALITMNYLVLEPGESIYIPADGIHAYLSGDIIECMARSNNVLNTGFCPRAERNSVDLFCSTLTFSPHSIEECMLRPKSYHRSKNGKTKLFAPPMSEFDMLETTLKTGEHETLGAAGGPSILLATKGDVVLKASGKSYNVTEGSVYFIAPKVELELEGTSSAQLHIAFVEGSTK
ncbi:mannose-6-phosphate isomerase [Dissoconium aciculare CBS 342.82]|uniref:Mannose-6-phosphate isomerase n=1 Tax=Dissoconium aciculare CBS 342.82 TaxID=1314786 RepID=A0A6J3LZ23_9PEZI|nr:mannose-6-phosphate isomerase [Dissoconium aciculare CBS 342.82]KAF1821025.1 mannose-6-phosphate isomerase [Dissoconium aciculare CBS 342.82]